MKRIENSRIIQIQALLFFVSVLYIIPQAVFGASYTVSTTEDELDGSPMCTTGTSDDCSLREAITEANSAGSGTHIITIPAGVYIVDETGAGEDMNATGDFDITNTSASIFFTGAGTDETIIDGADIDRVFDVMPAGTTTGTIQFEQLTIQNGATDTDGGGVRIQNGATTIFDTVLLDANTAVDDGGAIYSTSNGNITIQNATVSNNTVTSTASNGGGVNVQTVDAALSILRTTFFGNEATATNSTGGALYLNSANASKTHTIAYSTFSDNSAISFGGAIDFYNMAGTMNMLHSTFTANTSTTNFGVIRFAGSVSGTDMLNILFSTFLFTDSQRGIYAQGTNVSTIVLTGNILSGSTNGCDTQNSGVLVSEGYNKEETTSDCSSVFVETGDQTAATIGLGTLSDTGGLTQTIPFLDYSDPDNDAVDSVPAATCVSILGSSSTDQRGVSRETNGDCDAGAHEADTIDPAITILGDDPEALNCTGTYTDAGATASDTFEGSLAVATTNNVDVNTAGEYTVTYTSDPDADGNIGIDFRTVTVVDSVDPSIDLVGDDTMVLTANRDSYVEQGAVATDACDTVTVTIAGEVNDEEPGVYTLVYTATDSSGNTASTTRTVTVEEHAEKMNSVEKDGASLVVTYVDDAQETITPFGSSKNFRFAVSANKKRLIVTNGKKVKVYFVGERVSQKTLWKKAPKKKNLYRLRVGKVYAKKSYDTIVLSVASKKKGKIAVLRFNSNNTLSKQKKQTGIAITSKKKHSITFKKAKKQIVIQYGKKQYIFFLTQKGKLIHKS